MAADALAIAAAREATDVAPGVDANADPADARHIKLVDWQSRWSGMRQWFLGDRARPSQASLLRQRARAAIPALLETVVLLQERRSSRSDRSSDFRTLARWFAEAPSDAAAHRLWRAAFGLASSRHLTVDEEAMRSIETRQVTASTSWLEAPAVPISARLRATGRYQRPGAPSPVLDRSQARRLLAEQLEAEHRQIEDARRRLATGRPIRLSDLRELDRQEFAMFLGLLGDVLSAGPPTADSIRVTSGDGTLEIQLEPTCDGVMADIHTPDGIVRGEDHVITITDLGVHQPQPLPAMTVRQP